VQATDEQQYDENAAPSGRRRARADTTAANIAIANIIGWAIGCLADA